MIGFRVVLIFPFKHGFRVWSDFLISSAATVAAIAISKVPLLLLPPFNLLNNGAIC